MRWRDRWQDKRDIADLCGCRVLARQTRDAALAAADQALAIDRRRRYAKVIAGRYGIMMDKALAFCRRIGAPTEARAGRLGDLATVTGARFAMVLEYYNHREAREAIQAVRTAPATSDLVKRIIGGNHGR